LRQVEIGGRSLFVYEGKLPLGLVLVHEIMGRDAYALSVAESLNREGYHVVAIDLYGGRSPKDMSEARMIRDSLNEKEVHDIILDAWHLLRETYGSASRTGTIGFCMGGGIALQGACEIDFDFCIDYYGMMGDADKVKTLNGPLTLFLGSEDERVTSWAFERLLPAMKRHKKRVELHMFPNAGHAFHRSGWQGHEPSAANAAWGRTLEVLRSLNEQVKAIEAKV
jgi:carboxymethylenebutenolidase